MTDKIPEGWRKEKLYDEIVTPIAGSRPKGGVSEESGNIPSIGAEFITSDGRLNFKGMKFIEEDFYNSMKSGKVKVNDILICKDGAWTGKVAFYEKEYFEKAAVNEHVFILRPKNGANPKYLFYVLLSYAGQNQLKKIMTGSAQPGINTQFPKYFDVLLPPRKEQDKIVNVLNEIENNLVETDNIIKESEKIKKGLMQSVLIHGFQDQTSNGNDPYWGDIPEGWSIEEIEKNTERICVSFVGTCEKYYTDSTGVPLIRTGNIKSGYVDTTDMKYVTKEFHAKNKKSQTRTGDLLIARHGSNGEAALVTESLSDVHCLNIVIIRPDKTKYNPKYLKYLFNSPSIRSLVNSRTGGSTQKVINTKEISRLPLPKPPLDEQNKIVNIIESADMKINVENKKKQQLLKTKKGLMQKLLTGQIRVKVD